MVGIPQQQSERATAAAATATTTTMRNFIAKPQTLRIRNVSRTAMHCARRGKLRVLDPRGVGGSAVKLRMLRADNSPLTASSAAARMPTDCDFEQQFGQAILTLSLSNVNGPLSRRHSTRIPMKLQPDNFGNSNGEKNASKFVGSKENLSTV